VTAFGVRLSPSAAGGGGADDDARTLVESAPEGWWYSARPPTSSARGLRGAQTVLAAVGALAAWEQCLRAIGEAARGHVAQCYAAEVRWPRKIFWARRRAS
jgi:hypothetical protein